MFRRVRGSHLQSLHELHRASQGRNRLHAQVSRSRFDRPKQPFIYFRAASSSQQRLFSVSLDLNDKHEKDQPSILETTIPDQEIELIANPSRKEVIIEAVRKRIDQNVQEIIAAVEKGESQHDGEELIHMPSDTQRRSSLRKRWQARMSRVKRDRLEKLSKRIERNHNISVDDAWDRMLHAADIPYVDLTKLSEQTDAGTEEDSFPSKAPDFLESTHALEPDINDPDLGEHENDLESESVSEDTMDSSEISFNEGLLDTDADEAPLEDATVNTDTELKAPLQTHSIHEADVKDSVANLNAERIKREAFADVIEKTLALLAVMDADEWTEFESDTSANEENEDDEDLPFEEEALENGLTSSVTSKAMYVEIDDVHDLILEASSGNYVLTTLESNLLLARLVTSTDVSSEALLNIVMQIHFEMKTLGATGRYQSAPNATTYRILILALTRRFQAKGEAVKLFQEMMASSSKLKPEAFLAGMQVCYERSEIKIARQSMQEAMDDDSFQPSVGSYLILLDMLKYQNLWKEALELLDMSLKVRPVNHGLGQSDHSINVLFKFPPHSQCRITAS